MNILITDGGWRIVQRFFGDGTNTKYIQHKCDTYNMTWLFWFSGSPTDMRVPANCSHCRASPPTGLVSTLWFLREDK